MLIGLHALELAPKKAAVRQRVLPGCLVTWAVRWRRGDCWLHRGLLRLGWRLYGNDGGSILAVILLIVVMIGEKRRMNNYCKNATEANGMKLTLKTLAWRS